MLNGQKSEPTLQPAQVRLMHWSPQQAPAQFEGLHTTLAASGECPASTIELSWGPSIDGCATSSFGVVESVDASTVAASAAASFGSGAAPFVSTLQALSQKPPSNPLTLITTRKVCLRIAKQGTTHLARCAGVCNPALRSACHRSRYLLHFHDPRPVAPRGSLGPSASIPSGPRPRHLAPRWVMAFSDRELGGSTAIGSRRWSLRDVPQPVSRRRGTDADGRGGHRRGAPPECPVVRPCMGRGRWCAAQSGGRRRERHRSPPGPSECSERRCARLSPC